MRTLLDGQFLVSEHGEATKTQVNYKWDGDGWWSWCAKWFGGGPNSLAFPLLDGGEWWASQVVSRQKGSKTKNAVTPLKSMVITPPCQKKQVLIRGVKCGDSQMLRKHGLFLPVWGRDKRKWNSTQRTVGATNTCACVYLLRRTQAFTAWTIKRH